jgi:hypothetical protein
MARIRYPAVNSGGAANPFDFDFSDEPLSHVERNELQSLRLALATVNTAGTTPQTDAGNVGHMGGDTNALPDQTRPSPRRGRPPKTPSGISVEEAEKIALRGIKGRDQRRAWKAIAQVEGIDTRTLQKYIRWYYPVDYERLTGRPAN